MTQIYYLELTAAAGPIDRLADSLRGVLAGAGLIAENVSATTLVKSAVWLESGLVVDVGARLQRGPDQFTEDFGIERAMGVTFQVAGTLAFAPQIEDILVTTAGVLERVHGDALMHFEYDCVWLLRSAGRLYLSDDDDLWHPERLLLIDQPFERKALAFSDVSHARRTYGWLNPDP
jgi:hypothetical protein